MLVKSSTVDQTFHQDSEKLRDLEGDISMTPNIAMKLTAKRPLNEDSIIESSEGTRKRLKTSAGPSGSSNTE